MTKDTFNSIYYNIPNSAIAHVKTTNGDKICIKDNNDSKDSGINMNVMDEYIEIISITLSDKKTKRGVTIIPYESILQIEYAHTYLIENENEGKDDKSE